MRTIVAGVVLVFASYALQATVVAWSVGWVAALLCAASRPISATWDLEYADRRRRAMQRVRAYLLFRCDPGLQQHLLAELAWLRAEAAALDAALGRRAAREHSAAYGEP
jgi:hypothetical protein